MSISCRLGYIVKAKDSLFEQLSSVNSGLGEYFRQNYVLVTENLDYEVYFEGWKKTIKQKCKIHFVKETIYLLDYPKKELIMLFGEFNSEEDLFDKWWSLELADCDEIPTDWKSK